MGYKSGRKPNYVVTVVIFALIVLFFLLTRKAHSEETSVFFSANEKYTEKGIPTFSYNDVKLKNLTGLLQIDKTAIGFLRGYATANEGYEQADFHRRLNNMSAGDYRASIVYDWLIEKYPDLSGRIYFLPAVVDSTVRGVSLWAKSTDFVTREELAGLKGEFNQHVVDQAEINFETHGILDDFRELMVHVEVLSEHEPMWEIGAGVIGVHFDSDHTFVIPVAELKLNLNQHFGLGAVGGTCPTGTAYNRQMWSNAVNAFVFYQPIQKLPLQLLVGFSHASESVDQYEYLWMANSGLIGAKLEIPLGKDWNFSISTNGLITNDRIGGNAGVTISKSF